MDVAWIQVFVLTLSECLAPAGKTVCQERTFELQFLTRSDCEIALQQFIELKNASASVIVDANESGCAPAARQQDVFDSLDAINAAFSDRQGWRVLRAEDAGPSATQASHQERLARLKTCEETAGKAPCKVGEIIIEAAGGDPVEVWRRD
ncbi:MAG: hypothetical protein OEO82_05990 [Gammaproteobacteria bacterium]|nr:hypothetical protein [Gammaproteobacteria bacterium]